MPAIPLSWSALEKELNGRLKEYADAHTRLTHRGPNESILTETAKGISCTDGFRSDGLLRDGKHLLAIEVEVAQTHPDTNVGKYWYIQSQYQFEKIVLFHIYTPRYNSYPQRKALAAFYAEKMQNEGVQFEYIPITFKTSCDITEYNHVVGKVWASILNKISSLFP